MRVGGKNAKNPRGCILRGGRDCETEGVDTALAVGVQARRIGQRRWILVRGGAAKKLGWVTAVLGKAEARHAPWLRLSRKARAVRPRSKVRTARHPHSTSAQLALAPQTAGDQQEDHRKSDKTPLWERESENGRIGRLAKSRDLEDLRQPLCRRKRIHERLEGIEPAAKSRMGLHINVPSGGYHAPESGQHNQRFKQRDPAPSPERSAEQGKDCDQHEKVALNDAERTGIFTFGELKIERSANESQTDHSEQDQQSSFAANPAVVVVHGEMIQGVVHIFRIVREKNT